MNKNRVMWIVVFIVVTVTIATSIRTSQSQNQETQLHQKQDGLDRFEQDRQVQDRKEYESQFPVADYYASESNNLVLQDKRTEKSQRYDRYRLVIENPSPNSYGSTLYDETPPPPAIPVNESELVVAGKILDAQAYLSNKRTGVYSEFTIQVDKVLKNSNSNKTNENEKISADRPGGFVRYPSGQKLLYDVAGKAMPRVGKQYVLFLIKPDQSPNYRILTAYEIKGGKVYPIDSSYVFQKYQGTNLTDLIETLNERLGQPPQKTNNKH